MDNQASSTDDGTSVGRIPDTKRSQTYKPSQLANAGASSSSAAVADPKSSNTPGLGAGKCEFIQRTSSSFLPVAANAGFTFGVDSASQTVDGSDAVFQRGLDRSAEDEASAWCLPHSRNDHALDDSMKYLLSSSTKQHKHSNTLDNLQSSGFETVRSPTKQLNSNFAPFASPTFRLHHFSSVPLPNNSSETQNVCLDPADGTLELKPPDVENDGNISGAKAVFPSWKTILVESLTTWLYDVTFCVLLINVSNYLRSDVYTTVERQAVIDCCEQYARDSDYFWNRFLYKCLCHWLRMKLFFVLFYEDDPVTASCVLLMLMFCTGFLFFWNCHIVPEGLGVDAETAQEAAQEPVQPHMVATMPPDLAQGEIQSTLLRRWSKNDFYYEIRHPRFLNWADIPIQMALSPFLCTSVAYEEVLNLLSAEMGKSLTRVKNKDATTVKKFISYVQSLPDGSEMGNNIPSLEHRESMIRMVLDSLNGQLIHVNDKTYQIGGTAVTGKGNELFNHVAVCIKNFNFNLNQLQPSGDENKDDTGSLPLGFTFSFPCRQDGLTVERLVVGSKGFKCPGVKGQNVIQLLQNTITRQPGLKVEYVATLNDTVLCLMSCTLHEYSTLHGVIFRLRCSNFQEEDGKAQKKKRRKRKRKRRKNICVGQ